MMPGQTGDKPLRISLGDFHARLEAGEPATVFDVRNPNDWDRSNWKIPGALWPIHGELQLDPHWPRTRLIVAY
jgi:rhodanese-related sulfurtransferase